MIKKRSSLLLIGLFCHVPFLTGCEMIGHAEGVKTSCDPVQQVCQGQIQRYSGRQDISFEIAGCPVMTTEIELTATVQGKDTTMKFITPNNEVLSYGVDKGQTGVLKGNILTEFEPTTQKGRFSLIFDSGDYTSTDLEYSFIYQTNCH